MVGSAVGLLGFHGRLEDLAVGFRPVLNAVLDIDNYLRELPRHATPRARIWPRYLALLRHLCSWRDSEGHGYDAIVIVAHSQGTVISADFLRFLARSPEYSSLPFLRGAGQRISTYLYTVGCPLRQLYGWRFPHLYAWAYNNHMGDGAGWSPSDIADDLAPDPYALGVNAWVNSYGSGDYVGRSLSAAKQLRIPMDCTRVGQGSSKRWRSGKTSTRGKHLS